MRVLASFVLAISATAACAWPVPSCKEIRDSTVYYMTDPVLGDDGSFQVGNARYASCAEYCEAHVEGLRRLISCEPPTVYVTPNQDPNDTRLRYTVACTYDATVCEQRGLWLIDK